MKPFYLFVVDDDKHEFCVEGPMQDDTQWINGVVDAQKRGRQVRCSTSSMTTATAAAQEWSAEYPHRQVSPGTIVRPLAR